MSYKSAIVIITFVVLFYLLIRSIRIGGYRRTNHPPRWVVRAVHRKIKWTGANQYVRLKGKRYRYKVYCVGHGVFEYYKKRRR